MKDITSSETSISAVCKVPNSFRKQLIFPSQSSCLPGQGRRQGSCCFIGIRTSPHLDAVATKTKQTIQSWLSTAMILHNTLAEFKISLPSLVWYQYQYTWSIFTADIDSVSIKSFGHEIVAVCSQLRIDFHLFRDGFLLLWLVLHCQYLGKFLS